MKGEKALPAGFDASTTLPDQEGRSSWQELNRSWWNANPMRYDWNDELGVEEFSPAFYAEIDRRFFSDAERYMPSRALPFDEIVPFAELQRMDVLEIGVGNGSHAQLLGPRSRSYSGIDLTDYAAESTRKRLELFGIPGEIRRMDAEEMSFPDASFDFVWTWGVIHHSANTGRILSELNRVLRPGGKAVVMVYHRSFLYYYVFGGFIRGVLQGGFLKHRSLHQIVQSNTDGAIARFYRTSEWSSLIASSGLVLERLCIKGQKSEVVPLPASRIKNVLMDMIPNGFSRFILNTCRQGSFLISVLKKP